MTITRMLTITDEHQVILPEIGQGREHKHRRKYGIKPRMM